MMFCLDTTEAVYTRYHIENNEKLLNIFPSFYNNRLLCEFLYRIV